MRNNLCFERLNFSRHAGLDPASRSYVTDKILDSGFRRNDGNEFMDLILNV